MWHVNNYIMLMRDRMRIEFADFGILTSAVSVGFNKLQHLAAPGPRAFSQTSNSTFPNCRKRKAAEEPVAPAPTIKMRCIASGQAKDCESLNHSASI